jgi:hypothetical protein
MTANLNPNDTDRYPFEVPVLDVFDRSKTVAFGAENGEVICSCPTWWKAAGDELAEEAIGSAYMQAVNLARQQRSRR